MNRQALVCRTLALTLGICALPALVTAQPTTEKPPVSIDVEPTEQPIAIFGWIGDDKGIGRTLRLTARTDSELKVTLLSSDLTLEGNKALIDRKNVGWSGEVTLKPHIPKEVSVNISNLKLPGVYSGKLEIWRGDNTGSKMIGIPITVLAKERPALKPLPGTDTLKLKLTNCVGSINCWLAAKFLPASALLESWDLQFTNNTHSQVKVLNTDISLLGEQTQYQLTRQQFVPPSGQQTLPANEMVSLRVALNRKRMPPDHYKGSVYISLEDQDQRLEVPVDLSVRVGPLLPLSILLLGILLGRLVKYMQGEGRQQIDALRGIYEFEGQVEREAEPDDKKILAPMVEDVRRAVYAGQPGATDMLKTLRSRLDLLKDLRKIEADLRPQQQDPAVKDTLEKIRKARTHLENREDDKAKTLLQEAQKNRPLGVAPTAADQFLTKAVQNAIPATTLPMLPVQKGWEKAVKPWAIKLFGLSDAIRAEAALWVARPLLYVALLVGLVVVGMGSLYLDKGATFGANPFVDYLGLLLWGLSADVASRTLSNLRTPGTT